MAHKRKLFQREILTYKEILPRVQDLLHSIGERHTRIAPACYYTTVTPEPFLILEDMKSEGYENYSEQQLLNLDYVLPVIEKIAKLHACSVVLVAKNPNLMEYFQEPPIFKHNHQNNDITEYMEFYPVNMHCVAGVVSQWKDFEEIAQKLHHLADKMTMCSTDLHLNDGHKFRVFNVADLWIRNLLFQSKKEENEIASSGPDDVVIVSISEIIFEIIHTLSSLNDYFQIDFQLAYYGSPAMDLNYFLYGSVNQNVRKLLLRYLVKEYHRVLRDTLEQFNYEHIPTLKDITIEMIQNSLQGNIYTISNKKKLFSINIL